MDVGTGLAVLGSVELIQKLLGPTVDYFGKEFQSYSEKGVENLKSIFSKSINKLGSKIDEKGQISPRILKNVLSEGWFCEDEIMREYFGGVLASSRTNIDRDDRGKTYLNLISSLSTYQIRSHYIILYNS